MAVSRRTFLRTGAASGALLVARPRLAGAQAGAGTTLDHFGTSRASRLFPGTMLVHADLHNHSLLSDGSGDEVDAFASMRQHGLDVAALTDHSTINWGAPSPCGDSRECRAVACIDDAAWQRMQELADANQADGAFVALRGFEWSSPSLGHMNVWFSETWIDPLHTGGLGTGQGAGEFFHEGFTDAAFPAPAELVALDALVAAAPTGSVGMELFYDWLRQPPDRPALGGGIDGLAGFNHPGLEVGRFAEFAYDASIADRVVSIEAFNRGDDYLFEGIEIGKVSPLGQALDAGWHLGFIGVSDHHGDEWGADAGRGRAGLWVDALTRDGVREALVARRAFATVIDGLRLDASANGVRMGAAVPHRTGPLRLALDIDRGPRWHGRTLGLQVLRPSGGILPEIVHAQDIVVPAPNQPVVELTVDVDAGDGRWLVLRITDPDLAADERAPDAFAGFGAAVAYTSPFFLDPDAAAAQPPPSAPLSSTSAAPPPSPAGRPGLARTGGTSLATALGLGAAALAARRVAASHEQDHDDHHGHDHR